MTNKDADFGTWIERNPAPSVAELIKEHGSYGPIPRRAWRNFEADYRIGKSGAKLVCGEAPPPAPGMLPAPSEG